MSEINLNKIEISNEDVMATLHEDLFKGYEKLLRGIQEMTGASDEKTDAAIKMCDEKMKQAFFEAGNKLDPSR